MSALTFTAPGDRETVERGASFMPRFGKDGLLACVTVDHASGAVLMVAYMNAEALDATIRTGEAHYWSRSRSTLWRKGETSGATQSVVEMRTDCDQDTILLRVSTAGPACHTCHESCFYRRVVMPAADRAIALEAVS
jgi:phosphoribosyl-AMP cyclohydrolase